eukprot:1148594-Pelagomonas_calceolata.AAC.4
MQGQPQPRLIVLERRITVMFNVQGCQYPCNKGQVHLELMDKDASALGSAFLFCAASILYRSALPFCFALL